MVKTCPQCNTALSGDRCTTCQGDTGLTVAPPSLRMPLRAERWQQTLGGRVLLGGLLAVGLNCGLMQLSLSVVRAFGHEGLVRDLPALAGLGLLAGWQAVGLLVGAIVAGAGQKSGTALGVIVGVLSGLLFLAGVLSGCFASVLPAFAADVLMPGTLARNAALYGLPVAYALVGALGGWLGVRIWMPLPDADDPPLSVGPHAWSAQRRKAPRRPMRSAWNGPVRWPRAVLGAVLAVTGALYTKVFIDSLVLLSEGKLTVVTVLQDQVAYAEVFSLAILLGGSVAGANTPNGLKQGMAVGIGAAAIIDALLLAGFLNPAAPAIYPVLSTLCLGPIGGWIGAELLPPVCALPRRRIRVWC